MYDDHDLEVAGGPEARGVDTHVGAGQQDRLEQLGSAAPQLQTSGQREESGRAVHAESDVVHHGIVVGEGSTGLVANQMPQLEKKIIMYIIIFLISKISKERDFILSLTNRNSFETQYFLPNTDHLVALVRNQISQLNQI